MLERIVTDRAGPSPVVILQKVLHVRSLVSRLQQGSCCSQLLAKLVWTTVSRWGIFRELVHSTCVLGPLWFRIPGLDKRVRTVFFPARIWLAIVVTLGVTYAGHFSSGQAKAACGDYLLSRGMSHVGETVRPARSTPPLIRNESMPLSKRPARPCMTGRCSGELPPLAPSLPVRDNSPSKSVAAITSEFTAVSPISFGDLEPDVDSYSRPIQDGIFHPPRLGTC